MKIALTKPLKDYNTLEVSINHTHGGVNYFDNSMNRAGYFVHFRPMKCSENGVTSFMLFEDSNISFKIGIDNTYRKNKKKLEKYNEILNQNKEKILELYEKEDKHELYYYILDLFGVKQ
jgi:hypothetical protein